MSPEPVPGRAASGARRVACARNLLAAAAVALAPGAVTASPGAGSWPLPPPWETFGDDGWTEPASCTTVIGSPIVVTRDLDGLPVDLLLVLTKDVLFDGIDPASPVDCDEVNRNPFFPNWQGVDPSRTTGRVLAVRLDDPDEVIALTGVDEDYYHHSPATPVYDGVAERLWVSAGASERNFEASIWTFDLSGWSTWPGRQALWLELPTHVVDTAEPGGSTYSDSCAGLLPDGRLVAGNMANPVHPTASLPGGNQGAVLVVDPVPSTVTGALPIVDRWNEDDGYRAWTAAGPTIGPRREDGVWPVYVAPGEDSYPEIGEFGLECNLVAGEYAPSEPDPFVLTGWYDPGDEGCHPIGGLNDAPSGEIAVAPDGSLWFAQIGRSSSDGPYEFRHVSADLQPLCTVPTEVRSDAPVSNFYQGPAVDEWGRAYLVANEYLSQTYMPRLLVVDDTCDLLASVPYGGDDALTFQTPLLVDAHAAPGQLYVFLATGDAGAHGKVEAAVLHTFTVEPDGAAEELVERAATLADRTGRPATLAPFSSPVLWGGRVWVVTLDGTLNGVEAPSDAVGLHDTAWPRYRHDDWGTAGVEGGPAAALPVRGPRREPPTSRT